MRQIFERIGRRLKKVRETKQISQSELAASVDCDKRTIVRIEKGQPSTTLTIEKVATALGIEGDTLVNVSDAKFMEVLKRTQEKNRRKKQ